MRSYCIVWLITQIFILHLMKLNLSQNCFFLSAGILIEIFYEGVLHRPDGIENSFTSMNLDDSKFLTRWDHAWNKGNPFLLDFMAFVKIEMFTVECDIDKITLIVLRIRNDFIYAFDCRAHRLCSKINSLGVAWQVGKFNEQCLCSLCADVRHWKAGAVHSTIR